MRVLKLLLVVALLTLALGVGQPAWARSRRGRYGAEEEAPKKKSNALPNFIFLIIAGPTVFLVFRGIKKG